MLLLQLLKNSLDLIYVFKGAKKLLKLVHFRKNSIETPFFSRFCRYSWGGEDFSEKFS